MVGVLKSLQSSRVAAARAGAKEGSGADAELLGSLGIDTKTGGAVKKQLGQSKKGQLNKKEREVMAMSRQTMGMESELGEPAEEEA